MTKKEEEWLKRLASRYVDSRRSRDQYGVREKIHTYHNAQAEAIREIALEDLRCSPGEWNTAVIEAWDRKPS